MSTYSQTSIIFGNSLNLQLAPNPNLGGYIIAYDLDGILKQKDDQGVIKIIGDDAVSPLYKVLEVGNTTGLNHIILGTATSITTENGLGTLLLDEGANSGFIKLSSDLGSLNINSNVSGFSASSTIRFETIGNFIELEQNGNQKISSLNSIKIGINSSDEILIANNNGVSYFGGSSVKYPLLLSTQNSEVLADIVNSVILGGVDIQASESNTVYLGNNVSINGQYKLPSTSGMDGQFMRFNSINNESTWEFVDGLEPTLEEVLAIGNRTGTHSIIMGTQSSIQSEYGNGALFFTHLPTSIAITTDKGLMETSYIIVRDTDILIKATNESISLPAPPTGATGSYLLMSADTALLTTIDGHGFQYTSVYDFLPLSLISKQYSDEEDAKLWQEVNRKLEHRVYTIDLIENTNYTLEHNLNSTDLMIQLYLDLENILIDDITIIDSSSINLRSTRNLNDLKIILTANPNDGGSGPGGSSGPGSNTSVEYITPPPASFDSPGEVGQRSYDDYFIYECIQENTWIRYSLDTLWQ